MEGLLLFIFALSGVGILVFFVGGFVEWISFRAIRPPERQTFVRIRLSETQRRTVFIPAAAALVSGLFVSLSASFFYAVLLDPSRLGQQIAGMAAFGGGVLVLMASLWSLLKNVGEASEFARDPFSIRAAADEAAENPGRALLAPATLERQLDAWEDCAGARSMGLSVRSSSARLENIIQASAGRTGFRSFVIDSMSVFLSAAFRYPHIFGWPLITFVGFVSSMVILMFSGEAVELTQLAARIIAIAIVILVGSVSVVFYGVMRGHRARLWYRVNMDGCCAARSAIAEAKVAYDLAAAEKRMVDETMQCAHAYFRHLSVSRLSGRNLRIGRMSVSIGIFPKN